MSQKRKINQHVWIAAVVYVFIGAVLIGLRSIHESSAGYPRILMVILAILNTFLLFDGLGRTRTPSDAKQSVMTWAEVKHSFLATVFVSLYVLAFELIGYFPATAGMLIGLMLYYRIRSWKVLVFYTAGYLVFAYVAFVLLLKVHLI